MNSHKYLFFFIIVFSQTINSSPLSRLISLTKRDIDPSVDGRTYRQNVPSGSIPGTAYYGAGSDPNYGSFIRPPNAANSGGVLPISYNPNSNKYNYILNQNYQQQLHQTNLNNNNAWQRPNTNYYSNQPSSRYAPGTQGWYATGGNYWYNNGISIMVHPCLLTLNILILILCT